MGAGARQNFRDIIHWLASESPEWVKANIHLIPLYGRWDDLKALYNTPCEDDAVKFWCEALINYNQQVTPLASKWANRQDWRLRNYLGMTPKEFRKMVSKNSGDIVEKKMCAGNWEEINFSHVPSVAMARYRNAFNKHVPALYQAWGQRVVKGEEKVNAKVLFPHDFVRTVKSTPREEKTQDYKELMDKTFESLPDYITNPNIRIMPICDFSGSMGLGVSGAITAMDVSLALGLYCSDRLGKDNPFYRKLIPFSTNSKLESWADMSVVDAIAKIPNGYCGSTNIQKALRVLLDSAKFWNVPKDKMVNTLLILSDMQFDPAAVNKYYMGTVDYSETVVERCMQEWVDAGYDKPNIVYWNLHAYDNQPGTKHSKGIALVSGFSPSILETVLNGDSIDPVKIMLKTIEPYEVVIPE